MYIIYIYIYIYIYKIHYIVPTKDCIKNEIRNTTVEDDDYIIHMKIRMAFLEDFPEDHISKKIGTSFRKVSVEGGRTLAWELLATNYFHDFWKTPRRLPEDFNCHGLLQDMRW